MWIFFLYQLLTVHVVWITTKILYLYTYVLWITVNGIPQLVQRILLRMELHILLEAAILALKISLTIWFIFLSSTRILPFLCSHIYPFHFTKCFSKTFPIRFLIIPQYISIYQLIYQASALCSVYFCCLPIPLIFIIANCHRDPDNW